MQSAVGTKLKFERFIALRFQARNDSDFQNMAEDPRFTELLYPDPAADGSAPEAESNPY